MVVIKNPWGDKRDCNVTDSLCRFRSCLHVSENKGTYVQGRGYTSYHKNPKLVCWTNHLHGCPYPYPEPDPEEARCCFKPDFAKTRAHPRKQRCRTCGAWLGGPALALCKSLPVHPYVECRHKRVRPNKEDTLFPGKWVCPDCLLYWDKQPLPFQPGRTYRELLDERFPEPCC